MTECNHHHDWVAVNEDGTEECLGCKVEMLEKKLASRMYKLEVLRGDGLYPGKQEITLIECENCATLEEERDEARRGWILSEAWSLFEGGCIPDEIKNADWFNWDWESPRYRRALAERKWGKDVSLLLFPLEG